MTSYIVAATPISGHINPGLPIVRELVKRGHRVRWYTTPKFKEAVERVGAVYVPFHHARVIREDQLEQLFPDRPKQGLRQIKYDISEIFINLVPGAMKDLEEEHAREPFDVVLCDNASFFGHLASQQLRVPLAVYGVLVLTLPSVDTAPFGLALLPNPSFLGRIRNRILYALVDRVIFRRENKHYQSMRRSLGIPPATKSIFDLASDAALYLHGSIDEFEYPRSDLPKQVRFIGGFVPEAPPDWHPPEWWPELEGRRVVLVTQGTINNDYDQLIRPAIRALAGEDLLLVVTTGSKPPSAIELDPPPPNVRVEQFLPYAALMPKVDLLVTNGGYGTIQIALAHGVPVVSVGNTEEKPEIGNRVQWSGVGVSLRTVSPTEEQMRKAVTEVLSNPRYAARAAEFRSKMQQKNAPELAATLLESL